MWQCFSRECAKLSGQYFNNFWHLVTSSVSLRQFSFKLFSQNNNLCFIILLTNYRILRLSNLLLFILEPRISTINCNCIGKEAWEVRLVPTVRCYFNFLIFPSSYWDVGPEYCAVCDMGWTTMYDHRQLLLHNNPRPAHLWLHLGVTTATVGKQCKNNLCP